jgi:NDP-hexose-3-ketoreductase
MTASHSKDTVAVALWGAGGHARRTVLPALAGCERTRLVGVTTRDRDAAAEVAAQHGCRIYDSPDAMLADDAIDAVYLATPTGTHDGQGAAILDAGKHLFCEKSLTANPERSIELVELARARGLALCETFMYRHHPQFERVAELVASPDFGGLVSLVSRFGIPHQDRGGFRYSRALGGGALLDVGCYPINLAVTLLGGPLEVIAYRISSADDFEVDIHGHALLSSPTGARAYVEWGYGVAYANELSVWGTGQSLRADRIFSKKPDYAASVIVADQTGTERRESIPPTNSFDRMLCAFADAVRDPGAREREWRHAELQARQLAALLRADPDPSRPASPR